MKTDIEIQKDVMAELKWEPLISASEIGVTVQKGVVTLSGTVDSYYKKLSAERAASRVTDVTVIAEEIKVDSSPHRKKTDTEIAEAILNALEWHSAVEEKRIKIKVENGWVTMNGDVEWSYQKEAAQNAIQNLHGVTGITNNIKIIPNINASDIKHKIESALQRNATLDANRINVSTMGSKVILSGKVRSLAEKKDAERAAGFAPGVSLVESNLRVEHELFAF